MPLVVCGKKSRGSMAATLVEVLRLLSWGGILLLQVATASPGFAETPSSAEGKQVPAAKHEIQVCLGALRFRVPIIRQLAISSLRAEISHCLYGDKCVFPDEPIRIWDIDFNQYQDPYGAPILESLLGRKVAYMVTHLHLRTVPLEKIDGPSYSVSASNVVRFVPDNLKFMGEAVKMACFPGVPAYSDDEHRAACNVVGQASPDLRIRFMFVVASDVDGQWPITHEDWARKDWSAWKEPLAEVEAAVQSMIVDGEADNECSLQVIK